MDAFCSYCEEPFFGGLCVWCTCNECGDNIRDGVCLNCNSHSYDQNSFNNSSNIPNFYTPPPPSFYCYNCGNPSEEGRSCGGCFCDGCGYTDCMCYMPSADTSYAYDSSFNNFPQNDFMSQIRATTVIHFKIHRVLKIVGDRSKILILNQILITILMIFINPHNLPISIIKFLNSNQ
jgi:hypothetical protein